MFLLILNNELQFPFLNIVYKTATKIRRWNDSSSTCGTLGHEKIKDLVFENKYHKLQDINQQTVPSIEFLQKISGLYKNYYTISNN